MIPLSRSSGTCAEAMAEDESYPEGQHAGTVHISCRGNVRTGMCRKD